MVTQFFYSYSNKMNLFLNKLSCEVLNLMSFLNYLIRNCYLLLESIILLVKSD